MAKRISLLLVLSGSLLLGGQALLPRTACAAESTDVVDAFDTDNDNPYDFHIEPTFRQTVERGTVAREAGCSPALEPDRCSEPATVFNRELYYRRVRNEIDFDVQVGLHRNLELHVSLPVVISDQRDLEFADSVGDETSNVDPTERRVRNDIYPGVADAFDSGLAEQYFGTYRYFSVPDDGPKRSGLGDIRLGMAWAPFDDSRNPHAATLRLGLDYVAPTGKAARGNNTGVGRGLHELQVSIGASRRFASFVDPYFSFTFAQPFAASTGLFVPNSPNSGYRTPGSRFDTSAGTEVVLFDDPGTGQYYSFDLGFDFGYVLEGRDYSPLSDALSRSACNGRTADETGFNTGTDGNAYQPDPDVVGPATAACGWVVQQPGNALDETQSNRANWEYAHNGLTIVEGHATVGGHTGFNLQFSPYVEIRLGVTFAWLSPHFLTAADAGRDGDNDGTVDLDPDSDGEVERNPNYNLTLDAVGRRFRLENAINVTWDMAAAFQF